MFSTQQQRHYISRVNFRFQYRSQTATNQQQSTGRSSETDIFVQILRIAETNRKCSTSFVVLSLWWWLVCALSEPTRQPSKYSDSAVASCSGWYRRFAITSLRPCLLRNDRVSVYLQILIVWVQQTNKNVQLLYTNIGYTDMESPDEYSSFQHSVINDDVFSNDADNGLVFGHRLRRSSSLPKLTLDLVYQCCHRSCTLDHIREFCA